MSPEDEGPRPRRRKKPEQTGSVTCGAPGCRLPVPQGNKYCVLHEMVELNRRRLERQAKSRGDLTSQALLFGLSWLGPAITQATQRVSSASVPNPFKPKPQTPPRVDPFAVLGLEKGCSEADIRKRQREFAAILHADKGGGPTAAARLAEINTAAAECIKILQGS